MLHNTAFISIIPKKKYTRNSQWKDLRIAHLALDNKCNYCNTTNKLTVHHIIPIHIDQSKELCPDNLITLCKSCHWKIAHKSNPFKYVPTIRDICVNEKVLKQLGK